MKFSIKRTALLALGLIVPVAMQGWNAANSSRAETAEYARKTYGVPVRQLNSAQANGFAQMARAAADNRNIDALRGVLDVVSSMPGNLKNRILADIAKLEKAGVRASNKAAVAVEEVRVGAGGAAAEAKREGAAPQGKKSAAAAANAPERLSQEQFDELTPAGELTVANVATLSRSALVAYSQEEIDQMEDDVKEAFMKRLEAEGLSNKIGWGADDESGPFAEYDSTQGEEESGSASE